MAKDARSYLSILSTLLQSNHTFPIILWAGEADWICNWNGNEAVAHAVEFDGQQEFREKPLQNYTVNGTQRGTGEECGPVCVHGGFRGGA